MKLGYLRIPPVSGAEGPAHASQFDRSAVAASLGFSEFFAVAQNSLTPASTARPEHVRLLEVSPKPDHGAALRLACSEGVSRTLQSSDRHAQKIAPSSSAGEVRRNSALGQAPLSASWLPACQVAPHWTNHVIGSTHAGLRARVEDWRVARSVLICQDSHLAEATVKAHGSPCRRYFESIAPTLSEAEIEALIDATVLYGTPRQVATALHDIIAITGPFGTLCVVDHAWTDAAMARQSLALLAGAVLPLFQVHLHRNLRELEFA